MMTLRGGCPRAVAVVEAARASGLRITADMYTYTAGGTGLDAAMPPWAEDGGMDALYKRLSNPAERAKIAKEIRTPTEAWENLYLASGSADRVLLVEFKSEALKPLTGKTLAEVAKMRGKSPEDTIMDLVLEDRSRIGTIYFMMSDENVKREIALPWVSFASDANSLAAEGIFLKSSAHPRAVRQLRARARQVRARRACHFAARGHQEARGAALVESRACSSRRPQARQLRRRRRLRPCHDCRQGHIRTSAHLCGRRT